MILDRILDQKRREVKAKKSVGYLSELKGKIRDLPPPLGFYRALAPARERALPKLIAEVKKASPSKGVIREDFDPLAIARIYRQAGASALSVLTDKEFFQGSLEYLRAIREQVSLPALNKEFMVDELQFFEARAYRADAVLLIVAALDRAQLVDFYHLARQEFDLDVLIEVHQERELDVVLERLPEARIVGINNRDLTTFATSLEVTCRLAKRIPDGKLIVSESGLGTRDDLKRVAEAGARAVLIGESLMAAKDIGAKIKDLIGSDDVADEKS